MKKIIVLLLVVVAHTVCAQIRLPRLLSDNAVLQRDEELSIFGWASPDEEVTLKFKGKTFSSKANGQGQWKIELPKQQAGGPFDFEFTGKNQITVRNILFGDVWVCSGQSNMELTIDRVRDKYAKEVATSANNFIRYFEVPDRYDFKNENQDLVGGQWKEADPKNVLSFSAVAYFFARDIYDKHKIPIGLVNAALGGSPVESWMSEEVLEQFPKHLEEAKRFRNDSLIQAIEAGDRKRMMAWYEELSKKDIGVRQSWKSETIDDTEWNAMEVPGYWADGQTGNLNGAVWFTRTFEPPASMTGKQVRLQLGRIVDQDSVFINGNFVGTTGYQYPPRRYDVKPRILKPGKNRITVRVINQSGKGGFILDKPYYLAAEGDTLNLKGVWKYKVGAAMQSLPGQTFIRWKPLGLYNAMISPLTRFAVKGVIWYQGEANTGAAEEYAALFAAMVDDWRGKWNSNLPFLFVQLPNFMEEKAQPVESNWAQLRESQRKTLRVKNTGMAVAIDLGEWNDIHPFNKKDVGFRLSLLARKMVYGERNLVAEGPAPYKFSFGGNEVIVHFINAEQGLMTKDKETPMCFAISSDGKTFRWAKARMENNTVVVWSDEIKNPTVVRYAWADNPASANLYNKEGLPATPFEIRKAN